MDNNVTLRMQRSLCSAHVDQIHSCSITVYHMAAGRSDLQLVLVFFHVVFKIQKDNAARRLSPCLNIRRYVTFYIASVVVLVACVDIVNAVASID